MQWTQMVSRIGCFALALLAGMTFIGFQEPRMDHPQQAFTGYPPSVYMHFFIACPGDKTCSITEKFGVDPIPKGCCVLTVTNGDGKGSDEVNNYEVFLNNELVIPSSQVRSAHSPVKLLKQNALRVNLRGNAHSKIFVLIAYSPRESR